MKSKTCIGVFLLMSIITMFSSCKKEENKHEHVEPVVTFLSPGQGHQFNETDTIWLRLSIKSEDDLHDYIIEVSKVKDGSRVYIYNGHSHNNFVNTNLYFIPNVSEDTEMKLSVKTLDHNGNYFEKYLTFTILNTKLTTQPIINIISPNTSMVSNGIRLDIKATINHDKNLQSTQIVLKKNNISVMDYTQNNISAPSLSVDTSYVINVSDHTDYILTIIAKDIENSVATKTFSFHVHP